MRVAPEIAANCAKSPDRAAWLAWLPELLAEMQSRWSLTLHDPCGADEATCSYVTTVTRTNGGAAVLKLAMPHMEGEHEIQGLLFWNGDPTVRVLEHDIAAHAMLLERCEPGTVLRSLPEPDQDAVIASLLRRLWRVPPTPHPFRPLSALMAHWAAETLADRERWTDSGLIDEGLRLFRELPFSAPHDVLLATDLHAGNVLRAQREPWLAIDPKPFIGDPAYDATQHLFNCWDRMLADPLGTIQRMADLLELDAERIRLWTFARAAAEPRDCWIDSRRTAVARALAR